MFKKVTMILYKSDLFTDREISLLKESVEKMPADRHLNLFEMERHQLLKKIPALSYAMENCEEKQDA